MTTVKIAKRLQKDFETAQDCDGVYIVVHELRALCQAIVDANYEICRLNEFIRSKENALLSYSVESSWREKHAGEKY